MIVAGPIRSQVRLEADVELTHLSVRLACRDDGVYLSISELELELARDGDVRCRSAEGGFVEWLVRAIPAMQKATFGGATSATDA